jgi:Flp pilus assembly protein TadD
MIRLGFLLFALISFTSALSPAQNLAALKAHSGMEWQAVSGAYQRLGYSESAEMAKRKAREASR